jgi:hypothetical protein
MPSAALAANGASINPSKSLIFIMFYSWSLLCEGCETSKTAPGFDHRAASGIISKAINHTWRAKHALSDLQQFAPSMLKQ